ncbi:putative deacetylase LmbE-like domain-containing protein [Hyaloraphidium curvatum]|nr:putative deacetylase LmbE-like domain-containing protein [Hyaloraphidium curvatum]
MKLDLLVIAAHPDDAELNCGGTILSEIARGRRVGVVDLTRGELGTRGTAETRAREAEDASRILGLSVRRNLGLRDGFFRNDEASQLAAVQALREFQPDCILCNAPVERHPDHSRAAQLVSESVFLSGLVKVATLGPDGEAQAPWRPKNVYSYIQDRLLIPTFVVDISEFWDRKLDAIRAYRTQFHDPDAPDGEDGPQTHISTPAFIRFVEARAREFGHQAGFDFGEGMRQHNLVEVKQRDDLYSKPT